MKMLYFSKLTLDESGFTDEYSADKDTVKHLMNLLYESEKNNLSNITWILNIFT